VAAQWAGRPDGLWTLRDWANAEVHKVPWQATDAVNEEIIRQRSILEFDDGSVMHLHIYGPPGVGKTRFALELCRDAPWAPFVIYIPQANDMRLLELIDGAVADHGVRIVVVADEVQPEQLRPLREAVTRANGRIRLITIGHCPTPEPSRIPAIVVHPLDRETSALVVKGWYPAMPTEHVDFVVRFADGYVRLAKLVADAIARDTAINVYGLLSRDEIRMFLDNMLGSGDRRCLYVVAVLSSVGWTDEVQVEGKAIARHFGLDWNDVRAKVEEFNRRLGIVPRGGRYRYISPTPLAIYLAVEAWTTFPDLLHSLPDVLPTEGAKDAYYERLRSMASNPQAREYAQEELAFFFQLDNFVDARDVRRWSALSSADPDMAARNMLRALEGTSVEERLEIKDQARREIVWTLVRLAWRSRSFADATKALALLAEAENETWNNNATGEFIARFQIFLGGTALPYLERLAVLDELAAENRVSLTRLVVRALARAGDNHVTRIVSEPPSDELPEKEWQPSTRREHFESVLAALERLHKLASQSIAELQDDFISAAQSFAMMLRVGPVRESVAAFFETVRSAYPEAQEPLRRTIADIVYRERKYWKELPEEELAALDALHSRFEDASLPGRLRQYVGQSRWDRDKQPDLRPLARELIQSPATLVEVWPWLTSGKAADGWYLGEALAEEDADGSLLDLVQDVEGGGNDFRVFCGYVSACRKKRGDDWYDGWVRTQSQRAPRPVHLLFQIAWRCGVTPTVVRCLVEILRSEPVVPEVVGQLEFGCWYEELEPILLGDLLRAMVDAGHRTTALTLLEHRIKTLPAENDRWQALALELIIDPDLIRSGHMTSYYWKELALRYVDEYPGEIAAAIIREQGERSAGTWFAEHSEAAQVLQACVERNPAAVWNALLPQLSSNDIAYRFSIGFPRGIIDRIPCDLVMAWIDTDPDERGPMIAQLVNKDFSSDETLAARIVGRYGDCEDVASAFFSEYVSGSWIGPSSIHWKQLAALLDEVAERTELHKLRRWATDGAHKLRQMAERDRKREEEEDLRRY